MFIIRERLSDSLEIIKDLCPPIQWHLETEREARGIVGNCRVIATSRATKTILKFRPFRPVRFGSVLKMDPDETAIQANRLLFAHLQHEQLIEPFPHSGAIAEEKNEKLRLQRMNQQEYLDYQTELAQIESKTKNDVIAEDQQEFHGEKTQAILHDKMVPKRVIPRQRWKLAWKQIKQLNKSYKKDYDEGKTDNPTPKMRDYEERTGIGERTLRKIIAAGNDGSL